MEITDKNFWIDYWRNIKLPQTIDYNFKNDRVIAEVIKKYVSKANFDKSAVEIGCAPGKWLVFLYKELGYRVNGFEYIQAAAQKTEENLALNGIPQNAFQITVCDFLNADIAGGYDIVLSLGFVEHFENPDDVVLRHIKIINAGGYFILGMPNFNGIHGMLQRIVDRYNDNKMLPNHNMSIMNLDFYRSFAAKNNLQILFLGYVGGFERGLFDLNRMNNSIVKYLLKGITKILEIILRHANSGLTGGYILGIMKNRMVKNENI